MLGTHPRRQDELPYISASSQAFVVAPCTASCVVRTWRGALHSRGELRGCSPTALEARHDRRPRRGVRCMPVPPPRRVFDDALACGGNARAPGADHLPSPWRTHGVHARRAASSSTISVPLRLPPRAPPSASPATRRARSVPCWDGIKGERPRRYHRCDT